LKNDCVFGIHDFEPDNVHSLSKSLQKAPSQITYSLSPGVTADIDQEVANAKLIASDVNMYRITGDDWDDLADIDPAHFDVAAAMSSFIGADGLHNHGSFPDLDMLPLGRVSIPGDDDMSRAPFHASNLTQAEQKNMMTLWSFARSPLMFGGEVTDLDDATLELLTHPEILTINQRTKANREIFKDEETRIWSAEGEPGGALYVAVFNTAAETRTVDYSFDGFEFSQCNGVDVWTSLDLGSISGISVEVESHGAVALKLTECT
jgi:alpha-galactosidase